MKNFLIGLLALPIVVIVVALVYWLGAMALAVLGGIVAILCIAVPFLLKVACVVGVLGGGIWGLGKVITGFASRN